jgi:hypothetical protein
VIRVERAPEPEDFDSKVRQKGLAAIAELVGEVAHRVRPGRKRKPVASSREEIPSLAYPDYWTAVEDAMHRAYRGLCAYSALYIEPATGGRSIDHFVPRNADWRQVYEWSNFRLACVLVNSKKSQRTDILDPFTIEDTWFALEFVGYQVIVGADVKPKARERVEATICGLGLNRQPFRDQRGAYAQSYLDGSDGRINLAMLERHAPFVAREIRRQGLIRPEDA